MDIRHLTKQMENDQINANEKRKQAEQLRNNAKGLYSDSNHDSSRQKYLEDEAMKQENDAAQLEQRVQSAQAEIAQKEAQAQQLEKDRASKIAKHDAEIAAIDQQLANLRGRNFM